MRTDYIDIGPVPAYEDCAQVGEPGFRQRASKEMDAYVRQLERQFKKYEDKNIAFRKKWFNHDFGSYGSVVIEFFEDDKDGFDCAIDIEHNLPEYWDDEALKELRD